MVFEAKYQRILMLKTKASSILGPLKLSDVIKGNVDGQSLGRPADSWGICSGTCDSGRMCPHQIGFHDIVFILFLVCPASTHTHISRCKDPWNVCIYFVWCFLFGTPGALRNFDYIQWVPFRLHDIDLTWFDIGKCLHRRKQDEELWYWELMYWENQCIHRNRNSHKQMDGWLDVDYKSVFFYLEDLEFHRIKFMLWAYYTLYPK